MEKFFNQPIERDIVETFYHKKDIRDYDVNNMTDSLVKVLVDVPEELIENITVRIKDDMNLKYHVIDRPDGKTDILCFESMDDSIAGAISLYQRYVGIDEPSLSLEEHKMLSEAIGDNPSDLDELESALRTGVQLTQSGGVYTPQMFKPFGLMEMRVPLDAINPSIWLEENSVRLGFDYSMDSYNNRTLLIQPRKGWTEERMVEALTKNNIEFERIEESTPEQYFSKNYDSHMKMSNGNYIVELDGRYGIVSPEGDEIQPIVYSFIAPDVNYLGMARAENENGDRVAIEAFGIDMGEAYTNQKNMDESPYDDKEDREEDEVIEDDEYITLEPQEDDIRISPAGRLGGKVGVMQNGKQLGVYSGIEDALKAVKKHMDKEGFYPTIWWVSDHGNMWPIDLEGNEIKESTDDGKKYTYAVRGSHSTESRVKAILGRDPDIHSGMVRDGFAVRVTGEERNKLADNGIKINKKPQY